MDVVPPNLLQDTGTPGYVTQQQDSAYNEEQLLRIINLFFSFPVWVVCFTLKRISLGVLSHHHQLDVLSVVTHRIFYKNN